MTDPGVSLLGRLRRLHFMGAGGVGMCALAEVLLGHGLQVSGCDLAASERTERLTALGARVEIGHHAQHVRDIDALVITAAVESSNPELVAAREAGIPVIRRAELLGELLRRHQGIAVAGTHGKTTSTALVASLLYDAGLDPTVVGGGWMRSFGSHARLGQGSLMVCEADEFDRSFLRLTPTWVVITNIEPEHLDCYGSLAALEDAFVELADRVPFYGAVIACHDDPTLQRLIPQLRGRVVSYGLQAGAWLRAVDLQPGPQGTRFSVCTPDQELGVVELPLRGSHNVGNALAAIAVGLELELPFAMMQRSLASFAGVKRRFEVLGERQGVTVVDDYAHHPTELTAVLAAARQAFPGRRLLAVFQPHLYSRTRDCADDFGRALLGADVAVVLPVYPAREKPMAGVSSALVSEAARRHGHRRMLEAEGFAEALQVLAELAADGDVVLTIGAGDVHRLGEQWLGGAA